MTLSEKWRGSKRASETAFFVAQGGFFSPFKCFCFIISDTSQGQRKLFNLNASKTVVL